MVAGGGWREVPFMGVVCFILVSDPPPGSVLAFVLRGAL